jgi:hypothetical protein
MLIDSVARPGDAVAQRSVVQAPDTIRLGVSWEVAEGRHVMADSIGEISGIAVDQSGNVYASDFSAAKVWVFERNGSPRPAIGRKGRGPGEFDTPTGLGIGPDTRLYVRDLVRISRFGPDPSTGRLTKYDSAYRGPTYADWRSKRPTRFDADGRAYVPLFNRLRRDGSPGQYYRYASSGQVVDSVQVPPFRNAPSSTAFVRLSASGGRMLPGLNHPPFAPIPSWDVTPRGTLLVGSGDEYVVREITLEGREVRRYSRTVQPQRIPVQEHRDSVAALRARLDSVPVSLDRVEGMPGEVRSLRVPEVFPAYMSVYSGSDGSVWVRRWPSSSAAVTTFDVFLATGRFHAVVTLPRLIALEPAPVLSLDRVVAVAVDPTTGANTIVAFEGSRPR